MPGPLDALRKAQSIQPNTLMESIHNIPIMRGEMVALPGEGAITALRGAIGRYGRMLEPAGEVVSGGIQGASRAIPAQVPNLASEASHRITPVMETLGEVNPEFTAVGGEGLYNTGKAAVEGLVDPVMRAYHKMMGTMGR